MSVTIREERPEDIAAIRLVNHKAFGQPQEGQLIEALRKNGGVLLSLVAVKDSRVVGHILYSPVSIELGGNHVHGARSNRAALPVTIAALPVGNLKPSSRRCSVASTGSRKQ